MSVAPDKQVQSALGLQAVVETVDGIASIKLYDWLSVSVHNGNITQEKVDAVLNPCNERLQHGDGIGALLVAKGGNDIQIDSDEWVYRNGLVKMSECAWTLPGSLKNFKVLVHTVTPMWSKVCSFIFHSILAQGVRDDVSMMKRAIINGLKLACEMDCESVAMPEMSQPLYPFPILASINVIFQALEEFAKGARDDPEMTVKRVRIVNDNEIMTKRFEEEFLKRYSCYNVEV